jgi:hypothetical protein
MLNHLPVFVLVKLTARKGMPCLFRFLRATGKLMYRTNPLARRFLLPSGAITHKVSRATGCGHHRSTYRLSEHGNQVSLPDWNAPSLALNSPSVCFTRHEIDRFVSKRYRWSPLKRVPSPEWYGRKHTCRNGPAPFWLVCSSTLFPQRRCI